MSTFEVVALTSATSVLTLLLSRLRCIVKPFSQDGDKCISGWTDHAMSKEDIVLDFSHYYVIGREVIILTAKD